VSSASVPTTLSIWAAGSERGHVVQLAIREDQAAPHARLSRALLEVTVPRSAVTPAAHQVVSLHHHLHRSLESGATVRLRKAGTFRASWHVDLANAGRAVCSWQVVMRSWEDLRGIDRRLQEDHAGRDDDARQFEQLASQLSGADAEMVRRQSVDDVIRERFELSISELLGLLERRGLLDPADV
jgi:hypothetical protein